MLYGHFPTRNGSKNQKISTRVLVPYWLFLSLNVNWVILTHFKHKNDNKALNQSKLFDLFCIYLDFFSLKMSFLTKRPPLTKVTSKTALPNILKIASKNCIFSKINMRYEFLGESTLKPNVLISEGSRWIFRF